MDKYASRKFIITGAVLVATVVLARYGQMTADVALVLAACVASYNASNAWIANGSAKS